jgi:hypothetical protein
MGPGEWSLDEALGIRSSGPGWALVQLAAGAIGSSVTLAIAQRQPEPSPAGGSAQNDGAPSPQPQASAA